MIGHGSKFGRKKEQAFLAYQGCERGVATFYDLPGIPQPSEGRHHLIIELKRPSQNVNSTVISQTKSYAFAVAADERFQNVRTNWTFWALSNKMTEQAQLEAQMEGQPQGVVYQSKADARRNYNMTVWAKTWSEVIEQCSARLRFFQDRLNYNASQNSGIQFLRDTYPKFIPNFVKDADQTGQRSQA